MKYFKYSDAIDKLHRIDESIIFPSVEDAMEYLWIVTGDGRAPNGVKYDQSDLEIVEISENDIDEYTVLNFGE